MSQLDDDLLDLAIDEYAEEIIGPEADDSFDPEFEEFSEDI